VITVANSFFYACLSPCNFTNCNFSLAPVAVKERDHLISKPGLSNDKPQKDLSYLRDEHPTLAMHAQENQSNKQ
jgi:hypothetical protein